MNLNDKSIVELTAIYNEHAPAKGLKPIKKFSTKGEAVARVEKLIGKAAKKASGGELGRSAPRTYSADATIQLLVEGNPMREGKRSHKQFAMLAKYDGRTVADYLKGFANSDLPAHLATATLRWCVSKEFARLG